MKINRLLSKLFPIRNKMDAQFDIAFSLILVAFIIPFIMGGLTNNYTPDIISGIICFSLPAWLFVRSARFLLNESL